MGPVHIKFKLLTSNSNRSHQIQIAHIKFKLLKSTSNRSHQIQVSHWSVAKSMNTILSFHSVFHFTAILCDRSCQCPCMCTVWGPVFGQAQMSATFCSKFIFCVTNESE